MLRKSRSLEAGTGREGQDWDTGAQVEGAHLAQTRGLQRSTTSLIPCLICGQEQREDAEAVLLIATQPNGVCLCLNWSSLQCTVALSGNIHRPKTGLCSLACWVSAFLSLPTALFYLYLEESSTAGYQHGACYVSMPADFGQLEDISGNQFLGGRADDACLWHRLGSPVPVWVAVK